MMRSALMASAMAGLIIPATPQLFVPKPAIVKAMHLEATKTVRAVPLLVGIPASIQRPPPTYLSVAGSGGSTTAEVYTWTHTVEANASCLVVVFGGSSSVAMGSFTCTVNGSNVPETIAATSGTNYKNSLFCLFNPPTGTVTIVATASGTIDIHGAAHSMTLSGASSINTSGTASGTTTATINLTTTAKTVIVGGVTSRGNGSVGYANTITSPTGSTLVREASSTFGSRRITSAYKTLAQNAGAVTVTTTPSGLITSTNVVISALALAG